MNPPHELCFLYVNIGRGHPFYFDGIVEALGSSEQGAPEVLVLDVREGQPRLVRLLWDSMGWVYRHGGSPGLTGWLYAVLRRGANRGGPGFSRSILRRAYRGSSPELFGETVVVSHPLLVGALPGQFRVIYQHGEMVAPDGALVTGADEVLVPTEAVADLFVKAGYSRGQVFVSGLCIEPGAVKVAEAAYRKRLDRRVQSAPLAGLFVSSGAEPYQHVRRLISSITSCQRAGVRAIVLAQEGGKLDREVRRMSCKTGLKVTNLTSPQLGDLVSADCIVVACRSNSEESQAIAQLLPQLDFFVGPSHERTNWAVGLGLPMFALTPCIGPFAPLNLKLLEDSGTTLAINSERDAACLGETLIDLRRSGQLARMAESGWGKYRIDGFEQIARFLANRI